MKPGTPRQSGCVDVHEDAVDAGATPAPATRLALAPVTNCTDCPFNHDDTCILDHRGRTRFDDNAHLAEGHPPDWCALRRGAAVIELKEAA